MHFISHRLPIALLYLSVGCSCAAAPIPKVTSDIKPNTVTLGMTATYSVSVEGKAQPKRFKRPLVKDLEVSYIGTSQSMHSSITNGRIESVTTKIYNFRVLAKKTGAFIIPTYAIEIERRQVMVPAASLTVLPPDGKRNVTLDQLAFLELEPSSDRIYVGEVARCRLKLYLLSSITNVSFIELKQTGDAYSQSAMPKSADTSGARRNDLNYQVYSLPVTVIPLKSGTQEIEYDLLIDITLPRQRSRSRSSPFDDFFSDDFFSMGSLRDRRQLSVSTGEVPLEIHPLPEEGRPEGFSGAIGAFSITQSLSANEVDIGDPVTLKIEISGSGNFDRILPIEIDEGGKWKSYSPKSEFTAHDEQNARGTKTFEYVLIPESEDITETPAMNFSYFDPEDANYVDLSPDPIAMTVHPAPSTQTFASLAGGGNSGTGADTASARSAQRNLLSIRLLPGPWYTAILPPFHRPQFYYGQAIPFLLLLGLYLWRRRQLRLRDDLQYAQQLKSGKALRNWLNKAKSASSSVDPPVFFASAQRAIQESLSRHFRSEAQTLTLLDLESFFSSRQTDSKLVAQVTEFFQAADAIRFAGSADSGKTLRDWNRALIRLVADLSRIK